MQSFARYLLLGTFLIGALALAGCQDGGSSADFEYLPLFGDGQSDTSPVIARVGDIDITQTQLDLYFDELPARLKARYQGDEGRRLLLKDMVDQVLFVQGAIDNHIYTQPMVQRTLISRRRMTLDMAMRQVGLLDGKEPTTEELRQYYMDNTHQFRQEGAVYARHIECLTITDANAAYVRLQLDGKENDFLHVAKDFNMNIETVKMDHEVGWYNRSGMIPFIANSQAFIAKTFDMEIGVHKPIKVDDRWHVVEILERKLGRPMNFNEAERTVKVAMMPSFQDAIIKDYLLGARETYNVEMLGEYAPGKGVGPKALFARASVVADAQHKIDLYRLIFSDYPDSEEADDALFMAAMASMDYFQDRQVAARYLRMLLEDYPQSSYHEDASFLLENIHNPQLLNPQSIEDLRK